MNEHILAPDLSKEEKPSEKSNLTLVNEYWRVARNEWSDWREKAKKAYDFYLGNQWASSDKQKLEDEKRPALTINKIKPIIRLLSGMQRQNRADINVKALKGGSVLLSSLLTEIIKFYYDTSYADWQTAFQFFDGSICGKGWLSLDLDYTRDLINGDLLLSRENPLLCWEDPFSARYDLSDARFIFRGYWADKEFLKQRFPHMKKDFELLDKVPDTEKMEISYGAEDIDTKDYKDDQNKSLISDIAFHRYLVKDCWHRKFKVSRFIINLQDREVIPVDDIPIEKIKKIVALSPRLRMAERVVPILHITTTIGKSVVLQDIEDPFDGVFMFPMIRFVDDWIYSDRQYARGEVEDLIDPQQELNKRRSQALHHLNSSANSGWIVDDNSFSPEMLERVETMGSKPGVVIIKKPGSAVQRIEPSRLSDAHLTLGDLSWADMKEISGANPDLLGFRPNNTNESGIAIARRQSQGAMVLEPVFDNFEFTLKILGTTILEHIRKTDVIDEGEILSMADPKKYGDKMAELAYEIKQRNRGKYDFLVSSSNSSPTVRMANFETMIEALKLGFPIPPDMVVQASDWPFKDALLARLQGEEDAINNNPTGTSRLPA